MLTRMMPDVSPSTSSAAVLFNPSTFVEFGGGDNIIEAAPSTTTTSSALSCAAAPSCFCFWCYPPPQPTPTASSLLMRSDDGGVLVADYLTPMPATSMAEAEGGRMVAHIASSSPPFRPFDSLMMPNVCVADEYAFTRPTTPMYDDRNERGGEVVFRRTKVELVSEGQAGGGEGEERGRQKGANEDMMSLMSQIIAANYGASDLEHNNFGDGNNNDDDRGGFFSIAAPGDERRRATSNDENDDAGGRIAEMEQKTAASTASSGDAQSAWWSWCWNDGGSVQRQPFPGASMNACLSTFSFVESPSHFNSVQLVPIENNGDGTGQHQCLSANEGTTANEQNPNLALFAPCPASFSVDESAMFASYQQQQQQQRSTTPFAVGSTLRAPQNGDCGWWWSSSLMDAAASADCSGDPCSCFLQPSPMPPPPPPPPATNDDCVEALNHVLFPAAAGLATSMLKKHDEDDTMTLMMLGDEAHTVLVPTTAAYDRAQNENVVAGKTKKASAGGKMRKDARRRGHRQRERVGEECALEQQRDNGDDENASETTNDNAKRDKRSKQATKRTTTTKGGREDERLFANCSAPILSPRCGVATTTANVVVAELVSNELDVLMRENGAEASPSMCHFAPMEQHLPHAYHQHHLIESANNGGGGRGESGFCCCFAPAVENAGGGGDGGAAEGGGLLLQQQQQQPKKASTTSDEDGGGFELDTLWLARTVSAVLKRYSIPQAVFAEYVLGRSQGTLSDLLRNPKPWPKLKSGRETFRRMANWLQEPERERMAALRHAACSRKEELIFRLQQQQQQQPQMNGEHADSSAASGYDEQATTTTYSPSTTNLASTNAELLMVDSCGEVTFF